MAAGAAALHDRRCGRVVITPACRHVGVNRRRPLRRLSRPQGGKGCGNPPAPASAALLSETRWPGRETTSRSWQDDAAVWSWRWGVSSSGGGTAGRAGRTEAVGWHGGWDVGSSGGMDSSGTVAQQVQQDGTAVTAWEAAARWSSRCSKTAQQRAADGGRRARTGGTAACAGGGRRAMQLAVLGHGERRVRDRRHEMDGELGRPIQPRRGWAGAGGGA